MFSLIFASTFLVTSLSVLWIWQRFLGRRRVQDLLRQRNPAEQRATAVRNLSLVQRWERAARQAGLDWTGRHYLLTGIGGSLLGLLFMLSGARSLALLVAAGSWGLPWGVVWARGRMRTAKFAEQLPATLSLMANTIRAGGTLLQAVRAVVRQMPDPIKSEFTRVERDMQLQIPLGNALERAAGRIGAAEFSAVVVACKVAGQAGADLDVILEHIGREVVEDRQFRQGMRAASSESRTSAWVVTVVPIVLSGAFYLKNPRYFDPLFLEPAGQVWLLLCSLAMVAGWVCIYRMADIRSW